MASCITTTGRKNSSCSSLLLVICLLLFNSAEGLDLSSSVCSLVNCGKGQCVESSSLPFYKCQCNAGWKSPIGSALPCVLPNCSIDLGCTKSSANNSLAPAPSASNSTASSGGCSINMCGSGECVSDGSGYKCNCGPDYINLFNMSSGYCLRQCSLGADCTNLNFTIGGSSPPPPPPPPPANQGRIQSPKPSEQSVTNKGIKATIGTNLLILLLGALPLVMRI